MSQFHLLIMSPVCRIKQPRRRKGFDVVTKYMFDWCFGKFNNLEGVNQWCFIGLGRLVCSDAAARAPQSWFQFPLWSGRCDWSRARTRTPRPRRASVLTVFQALSSATPTHTHKHLQELAPAHNCILITFHTPLPTFVCPIKYHSVRTLLTNGT